MFHIVVTLLVSKLLPKFRLVIDLYPQLLNIALILVTLLVYNKFIFFIVSVAVQVSAYPIYENKYLESAFAYIELLLEIYTFNAPLDVVS